MISLRLAWILLAVINFHGKFSCSKIKNLIQFHFYLLFYSINELKSALERFALFSLRRMLYDCCQLCRHTRKITFLFISFLRLHFNRIVAIKVRCSTCYDKHSPGLWLVDCINSRESLELYSAANELRFNFAWNPCETRSLISWILRWKIRAPFVVITCCVAFVLRRRSKVFRFAALLPRLFVYNCNKNMLNRERRKLSYMRTALFGKKLFTLLGHDMFSVGTIKVHAYRLSIDDPLQRFSVPFELHYK